MIVVGLIIGVAIGVCIGGWNRTHHETSVREETYRRGYFAGWNDGNAGQPYGTTPKREGIAG